MGVGPGMVEVAEVDMVEVEVGVAVGTVEVVEDTVEVAEDTVEVVGVVSSRTLRDFLRLQALDHLPVEGGG